MTPGAPQGPAGPAAPSLLRAGWQRCWLLAPGFALAGVIALAATFVSRLHSGPQLLYALLFGVAFNYLVQDSRTRPGIDFSGRAVLRLGVGLLGARITAAQIMDLGWQTALTVVAATVTTLVCGLAVSRWLGMSRAQGVLSGGAVARVKASPLEALVTTDSIMATDEMKGANNMRQITIAPLLAEAIHRISEERSVSSLFD